MKDATYSCWKRLRVETVSDVGSMRRQGGDGAHGIPEMYGELLQLANPQIQSRKQKCFSGTMHNFS
jgi:hypothetical protein